MQRLFSAFPFGAPGLGLLLLRISVAVALALGCSWSRGVPLAAVVAGWIISLALCIGYFTPIAAILAFLLESTLVFLGFLSPAAAVVPLLDALALALLGPGAYSLDARLFGRRVLDVYSLKEP